MLVTLSRGLRVMAVAGVLLALAGFALALRNPSLPARVMPPSRTLPAVE